MRQDAMEYLYAPVGSALSPVHLEQATYQSDWSTLLSYRFAGRCALEDADEVAAGPVDRDSDFCLRHLAPQQTRSAASATSRAASKLRRTTGRETIPGEEDVSSRSRERCRSWSQRESNDDEVDVLWS